MDGTTAQPDYRIPAANPTASVRSLTSRHYAPTAGS